MKNIMLVMSFFMATYVVAQPTFGIHANGIRATMKMETTEDGQSATANYNEGLYSWKVGAVAKMPIGTNLTFMPQLNLLSKGGKFEESESNSSGGFDFTVDARDKVNLTYLELPLNVVYNYNSFFIGAGPSISYGIGGKGDLYYKVDIGGNVDENAYDYKVKFDGDENAEDDDYHLNAFEFGANIFAGYQLTNGLFFSAQYNKGLSNISPQEGTTLKTGYFGIGVGYFFGGIGGVKK